MRHGKSTFTLTTHSLTAFRDSRSPDMCYPCPCWGSAVARSAAGCGSCSAGTRGISPCAPSPAGRSDRRAASPFVWPTSRSPSWYLNSSHSPAERKRGEAGVTWLGVQQVHLFLDAHTAAKANPHLRKCLYVDDVDESEEEGQSVFNSGNVGQQAALRKHLHNWGQKNHWFFFLLK